MLLEYMTVFMIKVNNLVYVSAGFMPRPIYQEIVAGHVMSDWSAFNCVVLNGGCILCKPYTLQVESEKYT